MFHSFSSSSSSSSSSYHYGDHGLLSPINGTAAPHGGFYKANVISSFAPPPLLSSSPPYPSPLPSFYLHRSSSTHSLATHHHISEPLNLPPFYSSSPPQHHHHLPTPAASVAAPSSSPSSSSCDLLDFNSGPVRRVFSTGDLQGVNGLHGSGENHNQDGGVNAAKVGRYSAEERKERIERYRSKRNQRNFHKKITYACRKTLADSRPRVRGRFARNGENEAEETEAATSSSDCYSYGIYDPQAQSCSGGGSVHYDSEFWRQMQATLAHDDEEECSYDDELLASFADVFSMNLLS